MELDPTAAPPMRTRRGLPPRTTPLPAGATPRPRRSEGKRNRTEVFEAARRLVGAEGAAVSLARIADAAGLSVATVLRHFGTRADLLQALFDDELQRIHRGAAAVATRLAEEATMDRRATVSTMVWTSGHSMARRPALVELLHDRRGGASRCATLVDRITPVLEPAVADARALRCIAADVEAADLVWFVLALTIIPDPARRARAHGVLRRGLVPGPTPGLRPSRR